jgi:CBS domain-containing protein
MNIRDLMTTEVLTVSPDTPLKATAALLATHGISGLPVCDEDGRVLGIVSEATSSSRSGERATGAVARSVGSWTARASRIP